LIKKELTAMPPRFTRNDSWEFGGRPAPTENEPVAPKSKRRRLATTLVFTTIFFAGASLAAVAGDQLAQYGEDSAELAAADPTATTEGAPESATADASAPDAPAPESAPADAATPEAAAPDATAEATAPEATAPDAVAPEAAADASALDTDLAAADNDGIRPSYKPSAGRPSAAGSEATPVTSRPSAAKRAKLRKARLRKVLLPKVKPAPAPEIEGPTGAATIWLNSPLPDPTPPALRLSPKFASNLRSAARASGVDWAVMLGILRARGATGHFPADRGTLRKLAARIASHGPTKGDWAAIVAYAGDTRFADRAAALARYDRAVGLTALVKGLEAAKTSIATRLLSDPQVSIYDGGRNDIIQDKVDVRVLAMIAYLRESFGQVTVSSLISGHRLFARPGVVSAHIPGHAVDISGLGGTSIMGHQEPGGITERAVRDVLMVPSELMPRQVISLLGLGGPSFPLADHYNHIHIGY
jgi:hypothetical protein